MTMTETPPAPAGPPTNRDRYVHLYCCDENLALCGADLRRGIERPDTPAHAACPLCEVIDNLEAPCNSNCVAP